MKMITKPLALKEKYWTETENAAYARELFIIMMDFLVQDYQGNHCMLLPIVHLICNMQLKRNDQLQNQRISKYLENVGKNKIVRVRDTDTVSVPAVEVPLSIEQCLSALLYMESTTTSP